MAPVSKHAPEAIKRISVLRAIIAFDAALIGVVAVFFLLEQFLEYQDVAADVSEILRMEAQFVGDHIERVYGKTISVLDAIGPQRLGPQTQARTLSLDVASPSKIDPEILLVGAMSSGHMNVIYERSDASPVAELVAQGFGTFEWVGGPSGYQIASVPTLGERSFLIKKDKSGDNATVIALISLNVTRMLPHTLSFVRAPLDVRLRLVNPHESPLDLADHYVGSAAVMAPWRSRQVVSGGETNSLERQPRGLVARYMNDTLPIVTSVSASQSDILSFTFRHKAKMAWLITGVMAALIFLNLPILLFVVRPMAKLRQSIIQVAGGDLDHSVPDSIALADIYEASRGAERMRRSLREFTSRLARQVESKSFALAERQMQLDLAMESIEQGILMLDKRGRIVICNHAFVTQLGLTENLARPGVPLVSLVRHYRQIRSQGRDWRGSLHMIARCAREEAPTRYTLLDANGPYIEVNHRPIAGGAVITLIDVTERQRAHRHLSMIASEATRANEAKTHFLGNMSHELRTPLNAIIGFSQMIDSACFGPVGHPRYREYASAIQSSGEYLLALTEDLLDTTKIEAGSNVLREELIDLRYVLRWIDSQLRQTAEASRVNLDIEFPNVNLRLWADGVRIRQAILNVTGNAIKFTPPGGRVEISSQICPDGKLEINVSDTGIGISQQDISRVTLPFEQVETRFTRNHQGAGLGLPLAKGLVELHGGRLRIESTLGVGTIVTMTVPAERIGR